MNCLSGAKWFIVELQTCDNKASPYRAQPGTFRKSHVRGSAFGQRVPDQGLRDRHNDTKLFYLLSQYQTTRFPARWDCETSRAAPTEPGPVSSTIRRILQCWDKNRSENVRSSNSIEFVDAGCSCDVAGETWFAQGMDEESLCIMIN
ncbi:hypothetical protein HBI56_135100 [Parastagonospora nodorum]|uniref:Uncharacterized protein n=1 Tax=Phaeosphaeria nodorum (strain SN15 / ATCC MYA-4574 / FGSC 10173) TaxID=321614 RepID=A0A7U2I5A4_PHANO|nr:hypothetical protein HBH56_038200 [Parastagonospora nodorum]QRC99882.1 hypothetical protein JI435_437650 [Parastagonospora nodorum SN15]KAH3933735.1 hypothetical protein HBH54_061260 [Parastagonospora nodorum]KAH3952615.1 hypothetical protein HBH53_048850 [Parastagonospora nodorum]KAH3979735.1 hypothetical protein HBH51_059860 [Parastagonospora nodorum]